jgi:hypothetical protein
MDNLTTGRGVVLGGSKISVGRWMLDEFNIVCKCDESHLLAVNRSWLFPPSTLLTLYAATSAEERTETNMTCSQCT